MLYQKSTIIRDDDWGHFIDIDDMQINQVSHKMVCTAEPYYTSTTSFQWLSETYIMSLEILKKNPIKDSCVCSTFVTTFTLGSIMLCFII